MTNLTHSRYTPQEVATFARSYRKAEFLALKNELFSGEQRLTKAEQNQFLGEIEERFECDCMRMPNATLLLFIWPSCETAFLALDGEALELDEHECPGRAHHWVDVPNSSMLGIPDPVVVQLYRLCAGMAVGHYYVWNGWHLVTHPGDYESITLQPVGVHDNATL